MCGERILARKDKTAVDQSLIQFVYDAMHNA